MNEFIYKYFNESVIVSLIYLLFFIITAVKISGEWQPLVAGISDTSKWKWGCARVCIFCLITRIICLIKNNKLTGK